MPKKFIRKYRANGRRKIDNIQDIIPHCAAKIEAGWGERYLCSTLIHNPKEKFCYYHQQVLKGEIEPSLKTIIGKKVFEPSKLELLGPAFSNWRRGAV